MNETTSRFCPHCGNSVHTDSLFCPACGKELPEYTPNAGTNKGQWIMEDQYKQKISPPSPPKPDLSRSPVKDGVLWSWLKIRSSRQQFHSESEPTITDEEYMKKLDQKLKDNHVPATIERRIVQWDESALQKLMWFIIPHADVINPMSYVLLFNHVGNFTFVEEKTFVTPPNLPEKPGVKKPLPSDNGITKTLLGIVLFIAGIIMIDEGFGAPLIIVGIVLALIGGMSWVKYGEVHSYNESVELKQKQWNDAWDSWYSDRLYASFQEDVNGELSRIFDSVFSCIKQVNDDLFNDKQHMHEESERASINDMEELFHKHRDQMEEYK